MYAYVSAVVKDSSMVGVSVILLFDQIMMMSLKSFSDQFSRVIYHVYVRTALEADNICFEVYVTVFKNSI